MGTTSKGYRYPNATDVLANVWQYIKNLADDLNAKIKGGTATLTVAAINTTYSQTITFAAAYPGGVVPAVTVSPKLASPETANLAISAVTNTGFTVTYRRTVAANFDIDWHAVIKD